MHVWAERLTRLGYAARGLLYLLMGLLAAQVALAGHAWSQRPPHSVDQQGAVAALADRPLGGMLLALMTAGLASYGAWGFARAFLDPLDKGSDAAGLAQRFAYLVSGVSYTALLWPALRILAGLAGSSNGDVTTSSTEWLLARPFGVAIVATTGAWLIGVAGTQLFEAVTARFRHELQLAEMSGCARRAALALGRMGFASRGVLFGLIGYFMLAAAFTSGAVKAKGPDRALQDLASQPAGTLLLALVAGGLSCFGAYSALCARWGEFPRHTGERARSQHEPPHPKHALTPLDAFRPVPSFWIATLWSLAAILLLVGLLSFSGWAGRQVASPGDWLALDHTLYRALNAHIDGPLSGLLFTLLNHPGLDYLVIAALILGYCARHRPHGVALAAASIAVALTINMVATWEVQRSAPRDRPFLHVAGARTVIQSCDGPLHAGSRGTEESVVECGSGDVPPGARPGLDWRTIWVHYPSFPSGHMRETAALSVLLAAFWPASRLFVLGLVLVMGYTRVLYGAHYPSDVLGGTVIGLWSGTVTLVALVAARHAVARLARARPVRVSWEYLSRVRRAGRPDLDPLPARLTRAGVALLAANGIVVVAGLAGGNAWAENVLELLSDTQKWLAARLPFRPASIASSLTLAAAAALAVTAACRESGRWRRPAQGTLIVLVTALLLSAQVLWVGSLLFARLEQHAAGGPLAAFPAPHPLFAAALVSAIAMRSFRLSAPGQALAALTAAVSALAGAATVHAALTGYLCGASCGTLARHIVAQFTALPSADREESDQEAPPNGATPDEPASAVGIPATGQAAA